MKLALPMLFLLGCFTSSPAQKPVTTTAPPPPKKPVEVDPKAVCAQRSDMFGPFQLTVVQAAARRGASAKT